MIGQYCERYTLFYDRFPIIAACSQIAIGHLSDKCPAPPRQSGAPFSISIGSLIDIDKDVRGRKCDCQNCHFFIIISNENFQSANFQGARQSRGRAR